MGPAQSKVLIKAHILTGEDIMSKVGTKHAAKIFDPARYLANFGETPNLSEEDIRLAEEYLVKVKAGVKSKPLATTFDGLRHEKYIGGTTGINDLPPTSHAIRAHIHRAAYLVYTSCNLLNTDRGTLDPQEYGWEKRFGIMLPVKSLKPLPPYMLKTCGCGGKCENKSCSCRSAGVPCTIFCHGKGANESCKNTTYTNRLLLA